MNSATIDVEQLAAQITIGARVRPSERRVWAVLATGKTAKEAAGALGLTTSTVQSVAKDLHRKLRVRNAVELALAAVAHGVIPAPRPRL
jgi:DNA-binding NarL/FixJ family response regulator